MSFSFRESRPAVAGRFSLAKIKEKNPNVIYLDSFDKITNYIKNTIQKKDLVITVGAGPINKVAQDLTKN